MQNTGIIQLSWPSVSVVIVFHNEGWSPLMRTVHNVINTTPKQYLHEVVMIDDGSMKGKEAKLDLSLLNQITLICV